MFCKALFSRVSTFPADLFLRGSFPQYGLVFDAGSSHTSLFIYQWPTDKENNTGVVSQTFSCHVNGPGISSYADNPPQAGASLRKCLDEAMTVIPRERQLETPAYLGATAGMRLLRKKNATASAQVLEAVGKAIQKYPVSFRGARIITGEDEGAYGWITINYLLESFTKYSAKSRDWIHPRSASIRGALDLGGASTQISFVPSGHIADPAEAVHFRLYGFDYAIYTHSYLCYGQNQVLKQAIRILVVRGVLSHLQKPIDHPCYPVGYNESIVISDLYDSPCAKHLAPPLLLWNVTLVGTGNATLCRETFRKTFDSSSCSYNGSCGLNGVYQPKVNGKFLRRSVCLHLCFPSPQVKSSYPREKEEHLKNYCASANYILTLLLDGYGFSADTWGNIAFQMQATNSDIGWTLGYMLNLTNMIPPEAPRQLKGHEEPVWVASVVFIAATLVLCLVLLLLQALR
uniref:Ectonucleoside triphosphate diphosphohydrolase 8 n=1 Tax=Varanus komodoensis TaxID=61221 RepID=A0A8D2KRQ5_VARKO